MAADLFIMSSIIASTVGVMRAKTATGVWVCAGLLLFVAVVLEVIQ